ncbi:12586_t:CDS:2, partial [Dentiscutata heterogama]
ADRELRAWYSMLKAAGCTNIISFNTHESKTGFLRSIPFTTFNAIETFWDCFSQSLNNNPIGSNRKRRILSIIADSFLYEELQSRLY